MLDILVVYGLFRPFKWVSKAELFRVPVVGWNMWLNDYVPVLRGDRESIREMMDRCRAHLARGAPVMIFPEGTRSRDGRLGSFKDGAFRLAIEAGCPVIPIVDHRHERRAPQARARPAPADARLRPGARRRSTPPRIPAADALRDASARAIAARAPRGEPAGRAPRASPAAERCAEGS